MCVCVCFIQSQRIRYLYHARRIQNRTQTKKKCDLFCLFFTRFHLFSIEMPAGFILNENCVHTTHARLFVDFIKCIIRVYDSVASWLPLIKPPLV